MTPHQRFIGRLSRLEPLTFTARRHEASALLAAFIAEFGDGPGADEDAAAFLRGVCDELAGHPQASARAGVPAIALAAVRKVLGAIEARTAEAMASSADPA